MEIVVAKSAGFCFGVSKAVNTAYELAEAGSGKIFTLGEIIHNTIVIDQLAGHGVQVLQSVEDVPSDASNATVIIRAHGVPKAVYERLDALGVRVVDATCPFVAKIQKLVMEKHAEGCQIVITGNAAHPEVVGINGWCDNSAIILSEPEDVNLLDFSREDYCIVSQTTYQWNRRRVQQSAHQEPNLRMRC